MSKLLDRNQLKWQSILSLLSLTLLTLLSIVTRSAHADGSGKIVTIKTQAFVQAVHNPNFEAVGEIKILNIPLKETNTDSGPKFSGEGTYDSCLNFQLPGGGEDGACAMITVNVTEDSRGTKLVFGVAGQTEYNSAHLSLNLPTANLSFIPFTLEGPEIFAGRGTKVRVRCYFGQ